MAEYARRKFFEIQLVVALLGRIKDARLILAELAQEGRLADAPAPVKHKQRKVVLPTRLRP